MSRCIRAPSIDLLKNNPVLVSVGPIQVPLSVAGKLPALCPQC
jgi:hypothetical protein